MEWNHNGHTIRVTSMGMFVTDVDTSAFTLKDAREQIDEYERRERAMKREALSLPVVDDEGVCRVITGIHAGNLSLLLKPKPASKYDLRSLYADHHNTRELVTRRRRLKKMIDSIDEALGKTRISTLAGYSTTYDYRLAQVKEEHASAMEAAESINLDALPLG